MVGLKYRPAYPVSHRTFIGVLCGSAARLLLLPANSIDDTSFMPFNENVVAALESYVMNIES